MIPAHHSGTPAHGPPCFLAMNVGSKASTLTGDPIIDLHVEGVRDGADATFRDVPESVLSRDGCADLLARGGGGWA